MKHGIFNKMLGLLWGVYVCGEGGVLRELVSENLRCCPSVEELHLLTLIFKVIKFQSIYGIGPRKHF